MSDELLAAIGTEYGIGSQYRVETILGKYAVWAPKNPPVRSCTWGDLTVTLPEYAAHHNFSGYLRPSAFPVLNLFRSRGIDAVLEAEVAELTPEAHEWWACMKAKYPKDAILSPDDTSWKTLRKDVFHEPQALDENPFFRYYLERYGGNGYRHQPCYIALNVYADGEKLKREFGELGVQVWSLEEDNAWKRRNAAIRNALVSKDTNALSAALGEELLSQPLFKELQSTEANTRELAKIVASSMVLTSDDADDQDAN